MNIKELIKQQYGIIGESDAIAEAVDTLIQAAPTDLNVLITGETGTGKEVFAKAVHGLSKRKKKPFLSVNCAAIPESLLESELFGHEKGAFTGAADQRTGFFESADEGTIFLDEIGEMPLLTQVKLLRILESGEFSRLGSSKVHKVNVRLVAATNRDLKQEVLENKFRQDLYFRLNSVHILLKPLREHREDIPLLVKYFGELVCNKLGTKFQGFDHEAEEILKHLPWPGNIRELRHKIETVLTLEQAEYITGDILRRHIPIALPEGKYDNVPQAASLVQIPRPAREQQNEMGLIFRTLIEIQNEIGDIKHGIQKLWEKTESIKHDTTNLSYEEVREVNSMEEVLNRESYELEEVEKMMIISALKKHKNNRRKAADELGISQRTIYRKIDEYEISMDEI